MRVLLVVPVAFALALVAATPAASAEPAPIWCGFESDLVFYTSYHCYVNGVGTSGVVDACPDPFACVTIFWCQVEVSPFFVSCPF